MAHILIIEDEDLLHEAYRIILTKAGHTVDGAYNGEDGLKLIQSGLKPDLILLDLRMPKMDGIEFLKVLKPAENYPEVKIIVFSNYDLQKEIDEAYKYGAHRYMLKAWASPKKLVKVVAETLLEA